MTRREVYAHWTARNRECAITRRLSAWELWRYFHEPADGVRWLGR